MENTLIVLLGPTGVGKTDLSVEAAERTCSSIISADSRQFYKEMNIGTAVPDVEQLRKVEHHFIHFLSVHDYYSSSMYERDVMQLLPSLFRRNRIVFMTGGSGMYIDAVCRGIDDIPDTDPEIRKKYQQLYATEGIEGLRMTLKLLDPVHYSRVDLKNPKRIIRALEICETTGIPYSSFLRKVKRERDFRIMKIGLNRQRDELYNRINQRVDNMVSRGLVEEARELYPLRHLNALNTVGYRELFDYFEGKIKFEEAIGLIKRNSRRYAKRQLTWWSADPDIRWFHPEEKDSIFRITDKL